MTEADKALLKQYEDAIIANLRRLSKGKVTSEERKRTLAVIQNQVNNFNQKIRASAKEQLQKEWDRQEYLRKVRDEGPSIAQTVFGGPLNTLWEAARKGHAYVDQGRNPLPSMREMGKYADGIGDDIQENFTNGQITRSIADFERRYLPFTQVLGNKGLTGHVAGFTGSFPEGFTRMGSGAAKLSSHESTLSEKVEGAVDLIANSPIGGQIVGKGGKFLYKKYGKRVFDASLDWLQKRSIPATEKAVRGVADYLIRREQTGFRTAPVGPVLSPQTKPQRSLDRRSPMRMSDNSGKEEWIERHERRIADQMSKEGRKRINGEMAALSYRVASSG